MPTPDPRVDAYIARAAAFAQPILREIRQRVHAACPGVEEAIRWGMPAFLHRGRLLCGMAAFKAHAALNLWARDAGDGGAGGGVRLRAGHGAAAGFGVTTVDGLPIPDTERCCGIGDFTLHENPRTI